MKRIRGDKPGVAGRFYALLNDIDRAGHLHGTASRLKWLRLKATGGPAGAGNTKAFYALLMEIHHLGLIVGTDADTQWHLVMARKEEGAPASVRTFVRCHATFIFWRIRQLSKGTEPIMPGLRYQDANGC